MNDNFPISKNGIKCIGPCFKKGTPFTHPELLYKIVNYERDVCPTNKFIDEDNNIGAIDECNNPTPNIKSFKNDLGLLAITPSINFNGNYFLKIYYNIFSFDDAITWIQSNKHLPKKTINRILNLSIYEYLNDDSIIDSRFIKIINDFFLENIDIIYSKIYNYISYKNNNLIFSKKKKYIDINDKKKEKYDFIKNKILNYNYINKFIIKYVNNRKTDWKNNENHLNSILNDLIDYSIKKIKLT